MMNEDSIPEDERTDRISGIHKLPLLAAVGVAALAMAVVISGVNSPGGKVSRVVGEAVEQRALLFRDGSSGVVNVHDAGTQALLASYGRGEGAFIRQSMRALIHNRRIRRQDQSAAYSLQRAADGQLTLLDPLNGKSIGLNAFGTVATGSFSPLLSAKAVAAPKLDEGA